MARECWRGNEKRKIQKLATQDEKNKTQTQKHRSEQTSTNNASNRKQRPNIFCMRKPQRTSQKRTQIIVYFFGHIIVCCKSLIYGFWLSFWYFQQFCKVCHLYILVNIEIKSTLLIYLEKNICNILTNLNKMNIKCFKIFYWKAIGDLCHVFVQMPHSYSRLELYHVDMIRRYPCSWRLPS